MRFFPCALLVPALCSAAILPDAIGPYQRTATMAYSIADKPIWDEYGLKETESAKYERDRESFVVTAWRLGDTTGSMAALDWQRSAKPSGEILVHGNYLLSFQGRKPEPAELTELTN